MLCIIKPNESYWQPCAYDSSWHNYKGAFGTWRDDVPRRRTLRQKRRGEISRVSSTHRCRRRAKKRAVNQGLLSRPRGFVMSTWLVPGWLGTLPARPLDSLSGEGQSNQSVRQDPRQAAIFALPVTNGKVDRGRWEKKVRREEVKRVKRGKSTRWLIWAAPFTRFPSGT